MKSNIYIAEDEANIRNLIASFLEEAGYQVGAFETGDLLFGAFIAKPCDLVILDIMMPGTDGLTICTKIREISNVPIIVLTAKDTELDYVRGITLGGDDYLTKPFRPTVLMMRIKALLRRVEMENDAKNKRSDKLIQVGDLTLHSLQKIVCCRDQNLELTMTELSVLSYLMEHATNAVSREDLLAEVWGHYAEIETRVTDETIRRIRKKMLLASSNTLIQTVWGYGYKLICKEVKQ